MVQNVTINLNEENEQLIDNLRKYAIDNPELINRISKRSRGVLSTNRIINAVWLNLVSSF